MIRTAAVMFFLALGGCSIVPVNPVLSHDTRDIKLVPVETVAPQPQPELPRAKKVTVDGKDYAAFDLDGLNALRDLRDVSRNNADALEEMNRAYESMVISHNAMVGLAQAKENDANVWSNEWAKAETQRKRAEARRELDGYMYKTMIALLIIFLI